MLPQQEKQLRVNMCIHKVQYVAYQVIKTRTRGSELSLDILNKREYEKQNISFYCFLSAVFWETFHGNVIYAQWVFAKTYWVEVGDKYVSIFTF